MLKNVLFFLPWLLYGRRIEPPLNLVSCLIHKLILPSKRELSPFIGEGIEDQACELVVEGPPSKKSGVMNWTLDFWSFNLWFFFFPSHFSLPVYYQLEARSQDNWVLPGESGVRWTQALDLNLHDSRDVPRIFTLRDMIEWVRAKKVNGRKFMKTGDGIGD